MGKRDGLGRDMIKRGYTGMLSFDRIEKSEELD